MTDTRQTYLDYVSCLNDRQFDRLGEFVADDLTYNDELLGLDAFRTMLRQNVEAIPDLYFDLEWVVVQDAQVASIIRFDCTLRHEFLGVPPTGRPVSFTEHVFYRFEAGRIRHIRSLLDLDALRAQSGT